MVMASKPKLIRPYQADAIQAILKNLERHQSNLLELATGLGKTFCFSNVIKESPGRWLVLAHTRELIEQAAKDIHENTGERPDIEMGSRQAYVNGSLGRRIVVGSVQTCKSLKRLSRFPRDYFDGLVIDEGHHAAAETYRRIMGYFKDAKRLLVTATPKRGDKIGLDGFCDSVAYQYGIEPAVEDSWLVPITQEVIRVDSLDYSKVNTSDNGDMNREELDKALREEAASQKMVSSAFEVVGNRPTIWFCATVEHARCLAIILERYAGSGRVEYLSGESSPDHRKIVINKYKSGEIQHLLNCGLFLEGFNAPATSAIVMARPTKSLALYTQILGRGTRTLPDTIDDAACLHSPELRRQRIAESAKKDVLVIDYVGNAGKHKIVTARDVLGGKYSPEVIEYAGGLLEESKGDVSETLLRSQAEIAFLAEERQQQEEEEKKLRAARKHIKAEVSFIRTEVSPFENSHVGKAPVAPKPVEMATHGQAGYIAKLSREAGKPMTYKQALRLTKKMASGVIAKLKKEAGAYAGN